MNLIFTLSEVATILVSKLNESPKADEDKLFISNLTFVF